MCRWDVQSLSRSSDRDLWYLEVVVVVSDGLIANGCGVDDVDVVVSVTVLKAISECGI